VSGSIVVHGGAGRFVDNPEGMLRPEMTANVLILRHELRLCGLF
jgi:hypothetical protein